MSTSHRSQGKIAAAVRRAAPTVMLENLEGRRLLTTFTRTSPTTEGLLPAGVTEVGGVVLDLVGVNNVRVVSQLAASTLYSGFANTGTPTASRGNPLTIGTQTGFSAATLNALGGGIKQLAVRITLLDGDTATGDFDENQNFLQINNVQVGNFSDVVTQETSSNGLTLISSNAAGGFLDNKLSTGFFLVTNAAQLATIYSTALATGQVSFKLNDTRSLNDNFFDFTAGVDGGLINVGTPPQAAAEINLTGNGQNIVTGDVTPTTADNTDLGSAAIGGNVSKSFAIANLGQVGLTLTGNPRVAVSGANAGDFTVTTQPGSPINGGAVTTFTVRFTPGASGLRTATLTIANNDANEGSYTFSIQGTGTTVVQPPGPLSVSANGPYTINQGQSLSLAATATNLTGAGTYSWDVNGDGVFGDTTGQNPTLTAQQLAALGISGGVTQNIYQVKVRLTPSVGAAVTSPATTLTVKAVVIGAGPAVTSYTLVDADTDKDVGPLVEGQVLDLSKLPKNLNIRANTNLASSGPNNGKVVFGYDAVSGQFKQNVMTELGAPYALFGDFPGGNYNGKVLGLGAHTLTSTPTTYGGVTGATSTIHFTVVPNAATSIAKFTLVNAGNNSDLFQITNGMTISLKTLGTSKLNIRADVLGLAGSVKFGYDGNSAYRTELAAPFALFGDFPVGTYYSGALTLGTHTLSATPYSGPNGTGTAGATSTITFTVVA